jgi:hypothetical protein
MFGNMVSWRFFFVKMRFAAFVPRSISASKFNFSDIMAKFRHVAFLAHFTG